MDARPSQYLRPCVGIAEVALVENQAVARDRTSDRHTHALAIDGNVGVEREDAARNGVGDPRAA